MSCQTELTSRVKNNGYFCLELHGDVNQIKSYLLISQSGPLNFDLMTPTVCLNLRLPSSLVDILPLELSKTGCIFYGQ